MAVIDIHQASSKRAIDGLNYVKSLVHRYLDYRHKRRAVSELRSLGSRTLKDMGLHRSEINSLVHCDRKERRRFFQLID